MGASKRRGRGEIRQGGQRQDDRLVVGGPHAVEAALAGGQTVERVFLSATAGRRAQVLADTARERGVPVSSVGDLECDRMAGTRAQGIAAITTFVYADHAAVLQDAAQNGGLVVYLDGVTDPHNLGAIIRTAAAAGVCGVVLPGRRSAPVTAAVVRVSAGTALSVPVVRAGNLVQALNDASRAGLWVIGLDHRSERVLGNVIPAGGQALVIGGEGEGLHRLAAETCHELARLPMSGPVESLNASVAAALAIYRLQERRLYGADRG